MRFPDWRDAPTQYAAVAYSGVTKFLQEDVIPRFALFFLLFVLLSGCAAPALAPTFTPTSLPTDTPQPSPTPTSTLTETPTFTPTPTTFSDSLGVTQVFATKLNSEGINSTLTKQENGWMANQVVSGWKQDGTTTTEQKVNIVSFLYTLVHNAAYPDGILVGTDNQGKTVFWSEEEKTWVRPLEISSDIENPTFYPWGKQYLALETCLLNPALNAPFSDEAVKNFQGWSIDFVYDPATDSSQAYLRSRDMKTSSIRWALDETGKPVWFTTTSPDGNVYQSILTQLLNPADPAHPKADETMFVLATAGIWWNTFPVADAGYRELFNSWYMKGENSYDTRRFYEWLSPQIVLGQKNGWFTKEPRWGSFPPQASLDSLLSQPENSLDKIGGALGYNIKGRMDQMGPSQTIIELIISNYPEDIKQLINIQNAVWPLFFSTKP